MHKQRSHSRVSPNPSAFSWNAGGWFGSQFGSTLWLLVVGVLSLFSDLSTIGVYITGFVLVNTVLFAGNVTRFCHCYCMD